MAVTQYIGARYVPLFYTASDNSNDWEAGVQYEPLTIVTYLNQSYTSKIPVPASVGNPADNPTYWILTGAYNAQVNQLAQDVDDLDNDVQQLASILLAPERHIIVIVDSYGTYSGDNQNYVTYNLYDRLMNYLGWDNSKVHYNAVNGSGFVNGLFLSDIQAVSVSDPDLVEDVYVLGGWNDEIGRTADHTAAKIASQAAAFKTYVESTYPNAKCHIMATGWGFRSANNMQNLTSTITAYKNLRKAGWIYHERMEYVMRNSTLFFTGEVHPNQNGVDALAAVLANEICGVPGHVEYRVTQSWTNEAASPAPVVNHPSASTMRIQQTMLDGHVDVDIYCTRAQLTYITPQSWSLSGTQAYDILYFDGPTLVKGYLNNICTDVTLLAYDSSNVEYVIMGILVILDGAIRFIPQIKLDGNGSAITLTVAKFILPEAHFSVNMGTVTY